jgi:hypothetical protein
MTSQNDFARRPAMLHGHHEVISRKQHDLATVDLCSLIVIAERLEHDEQALVVDVELGALVGVNGVLDREGVRGEVEGEVVELIERRFMQAEPDEAVRNAPRFGDGLRHINRLPLSVRVEGTVDDHLLLLATRRPDAVHAGRIWSARGRIAGCESAGAYRYNGRPAGAMPP